MVDLNLPSIGQASWGDEVLDSFNEIKTWINTTVPATYAAIGHSHGGGGGSGAEPSLPGDDTLLLTVDPAVWGIGADGFGYSDPDGAAATEAAWLAPNDDGVWTLTTFGAVA